MSKKNLYNFIKYAIKEDVGDGDHSSLGSIPRNSINKAELLVKDKGIIAGIDLAKKIFEYIDTELSFNQILKDGDNVNKGDVAFYIEGNSTSILTAERLVLNCMQNMSAIATKTNFMNSLVNNSKCKILDTRKTTPHNRIIEKWAVEIGGGVNHRFGLYDVIMLKDNHIDFAGGIEKAFLRMKKYLKAKNKKLDIIIEARSIKEVNDIMKLDGVKRILLDNFDIPTTKKAVKLIGKKNEIESSGGINEQNINDYANCGVDYISLGCLTHTLKNFDLSLKAIKK